MSEKVLLRFSPRETRSLCVQSSYSLLNQKNRRTWQSPQDSQGAPLSLVVLMEAVVVASFMEAFPCVNSSHRRKRRSSEHGSGEEKLAWLGTPLKVGGFDFNGNFSTLEKREMLQAPSHPASHVGTFCVLKLQFFRHVQLLLALVWF